MTLHTGKDVSESYTTMVCECGQMNRHVGASKVYVCADPNCAAHGGGVPFDRNLRSSCFIGLNNVHMLYYDPVIVNPGL